MVILINGEKMSNDVISYYMFQYPQLTLGIKEGKSSSEEYKNIVLRGIFPEKLTFPFEGDILAERILMDTPVGKKEALYLPDREIFEYFMRVLAYKCEPVDIPSTTGAIMISGINNWNKIYAHRDEFLKDHPESMWNDEFKSFISVKENYKDSILLISKGGYSNVSFENTKYEAEEWLNISKDLRIYHELTHYVCRIKYLEHKSPVRDEVIADCIGLLGATKDYDCRLAKYVLGIEGDTYRQGGRLENYVDEDKLNDAFLYAKKLVDELKAFFDGKEASREPFDWLLAIEDEYIGKEGIC